MRNLLILLLTLQLADIATTLYALRIGGREANPLLARLFAMFGAWQTLVAIKGAFVVLILYAHFHGLLAPWLYWAAVIGYAGLIAWNVYQISKLKK